MNSVSMSSQPLSALPLIFFDFETTGLAPALGHRVCELALRRVRGTTIEAEYTTLVNPQRPLDPGAMAVNGITPDMLQGAPLFAAVADTFTDLIAGGVLIAHNAPFDMAFLRHELALLGQPAPLNPVIDTLVLARRLLRCSACSLQALAGSFGVQTAPAHRAMQDVLALQGIFEHMYGQLCDLDISTLEDVRRYERGLMPGDPEPESPHLVALALRERRLLRIIYSSKSTPEPTERLIQPIELVQQRKGVYLRAYCYLRNDLRTFALDKIEGIEME